MAKSKKKGKTTVAKSKKKGKTTGSDFRCSFNRIFQILHRDEVTEAHLEACRSSPFYDLFRGIYTLHKSANITKSDEQLRHLITMFDGRDGGFSLPKEYGGKVLYLTVQDIKLVFGIRCGKQKIEERSESAIRETYFSGAPRELLTKFITAAIDRMLVEDANKTKKREDDFAKLLTLLALASIFFAVKGDYAPTRLVGYVDDLVDMSKYDWPTEIHTVLMKSLKKKYKTSPSKVTGCSLAILVWFYERVAICSQIRPQANPRCLRWELSKKPSELKDPSSSKSKIIKTCEAIRMSSDEKRLYLHVSGDEEKEEEEEPSEDEETSEEEEDGEGDEIVYTATTQPEDRDFKEKTMAMEINRLTSENASLQTRLVAVETERDGLQVDLNQLAKDYDKLKDIIKRLSPDEFAKVEEDESKCDISSCEEDESLLLTCVTLDVDEKTPTPLRAVPPSNKKSRSMMNRIKGREDRRKKMDADYVYLDPKKTKRVRDNNVEVERKSKRVTVEKKDKKGKAKGNEQKDITKGKSKGKVKLDILADVAAVDVDIDSDFEHDEDRPVEKVKLRKTDTYMILVSDGVIDHVEAHIAARGHIARSLIWQQDDNSWVLFVNLRQIERLINEDFTDATVLNAYISMLQRDHDERNAEIGNPPFTIYCLDTYVSSYMKQNLEGAKKDHIIAPIMARPLPTFLVFPLHHGEGAGIGHWTVVLCETRTKIWTHYDSMAPRHTYSTRYNFARKLMGYVDNNVQMGDVSVTEPTIIQNKDCPQQDAGSLDCGLFVLNVIRSYFMKGLMEPSEDNSFVRRLRADIVKKFLRIDDKVSKVDVAAPSQPNFNLLSQDTVDNVAPPSQPNFNLLSQDPLV